MQVLVLAGYDVVVSTVLLDVDRTLPEYFEAITILAMTICAIIKCAMTIYAI